MPNKKKKGFRRSLASKSIRHPQRSQRRKQWTADQMEAAIYSVTHDGLSGNKAADLHGVPRSTLKDRLSGRVKHGTNPGPKPYLTLDEEAELTSRLLQAAEIGFGKTRRDVKCIVETYVRQNDVSPLSSLFSNNLTSGGDSAEKSPSSGEIVNSSLIEPTFSIEEQLRYARRFKEGYDLPDTKYEACLKIKHPEVVNNPGVSTDYATSNSSLLLSSPLLSSTPSQRPSLCVSTASEVSGPNTQHQSKLATPSRSNQPSKSARSPFSDLLNLPPRPSVNAKTPKTGRARVLTSSECQRLLLEKKEEKKKVAQEKERRKQERELSKKQKEEEQKHKAEEKAHKAAEREATKAKKEAEKAERQAAKAERTKKKELEKSCEVGKKRQASCPIATTPRPKRNKIKENVDESINGNLCCVCFGSYVGTGREWLQCSCSRWIHEDCIDDEDVEENSGRLCPLC